MLCEEYKLDMVCTPGKLINTVVLWKFALMLTHHQ